MVILIEVGIADLCSAMVIWTMFRLIERGNLGEGASFIAGITALFFCGIAGAAAGVSAIDGVLWLAVASGALQIAVMVVNVAWARIIVVWYGVKPPPPAFDAYIQRLAVTLVVQLAVWVTMLATLGTSLLWQIVNLVVSALVAYGVYRIPWLTRKLQQRVDETHAADVAEWAADDTSVLNNKTENATK